MSHYDRDAVEDLKLIKLDLLSVRGLAAISETKTRSACGRSPPDDPAAFALLKKARTIGCFQVESPAMMNLLRRMKPANIRDLTQALALIRPGPDRERDEGGPAPRPGGPGRSAPIRSWTGSCRRRAGSCSTRSRSCRSPSGWPACRPRRATSCGGA